MCAGTHECDLTERRCACDVAQAVERQGVDAVSVRVGSLEGQPQAQLDGFKSRVLRAAAPAAQKHLYTTEWRVSEAPLTDNGAASLVIGDYKPASLRREMSRNSNLIVERNVKFGSVVIAAMGRRSCELKSLFALDMAIALVQILTTYY